LPVDQDVERYAVFVALKKVVDESRYSMSLDVYIDLLASCPCESLQGSPQGVALTSLYEKLAVSFFYMEIWVSGAEASSHAGL
jgi:hypothetical protein